MESKVLAEIVTYTPDVDILKQNILSVLNQVDEILIYDNSSKNIDDFKDFVINHGCTLIRNGSNRGIAEALAYGIDYAKENGYKYVYSLDDDTISNFDCVEKLKTALMQNDDIAFIGCGTEIGLYDEFPEETKNGLKIVRQIVTAGSLIDVDRAIEVGNYNRDLFIDWVDVEMCYRLLRKGFKTAIHYDAVMKHMVGEPSMRKIFNKRIYLYNYSVFRLYYIYRNIYYLYKTYPEIKHSKNESRWIWYNWPIRAVIFEKNGFAKFRAIVKGVKNGKTLVKRGKAISYEEAFKIKV